jgi:hypothetical protein
MVFLSFIGVCLYVLFRFWVLGKSKFVEVLLWFVSIKSFLANYTLILSERESIWLAFFKCIFVKKDKIWPHLHFAYIHQHIFFALCIILRSVNNDLLNVCNCSHCVHLHGWLKLNNHNAKIGKTLNCLAFSTLVSILKIWGLNPCGKEFKKIHEWKWDYIKRNNLKKKGLSAIWHG